MNIVNRIYSSILDHPWKILLSIGSLTIGFILSINTIKYDFAIEQLFAEGKAPVEEYFEFQREFEREDNIVMMIHRLPQKPRSSYLDSLSQLVTKLTNSNYFSQIFSMGDISEIQGQDNRTSINETIGSIVPFRIVSNDSTRGSIWLTLRDRFNSHGHRAEMVRYLRELTISYDWDWVFSGVPVVRTTYVEYMIADNLRFIPPVTLILILVLGFLFRHWLYVVLPIGTVALTACWILGIMSLTGKGLNVMTYMVPTLLFIIGISDSIHLLSRLNVYLGRGMDIRNALVEAMDDMSKALFLTSLTTALGFLALLFASIAIVREFGLFIAIGVFLAYILTLSFIPAMLIIFKRRIPVVGSSEKNRRFYFLRKVGELVTRRPKQTLVISIFVTILAGSGILGLTTNSSLLTDLHPQSGLYTELKSVEKWFGGVLPFEIIITKDDTSYVSMRDSLVMSNLEGLDRYLSVLLPEAQWISIPLIFKKLLSYFENEASFPPDQGTLDHLYLLTEGSFDSMINFDETKVRVSGILPDLSSSDAIALENSIKEYAAVHFPDWLTVNITGTMPVALKTNGYLVMDLFSGFGLAFIAISIIMGLMFLSKRIGLISLLPNLIPIIFAAGFLGYAHIPLRPPTAITFAVCLGIAVDDTLHFLFRFWQERRKGCNPDTAILNTIETTGLAMLTSTMVLVAGFLVLITSTFIPTAQFGLISAFTLTVAFVTDITLLPALLLLVPNKFAGSGSQ